MVSRLHILFELHKLNHTTLAEKEELMQLLLDPDNEKESEDLLEQLWEDFEPVSQVFSETESKDILNTALASDSKDLKGISGVWKWQQILKVAAVVLLLLSLAMLFIKNPVNSNLQQLPATAKTNIKELKKMPNTSDRAILTLADGSEIDLSGLSNGKINNQSGINITKTKDGQIVYTISDKDMLAKSSLKKETQYHTISTPRGGQFQINLPDGSKVWLNAASSLKFPTMFSKSARMVELTGEAYFEINRKEINNVLIPFKVVSNIGNGRKQEVEVLGTHFNVQAYENESFIKTTLLEGKVKVINLSSKSENTLRPGQQAIMSNSINRITEVDMEEIMGWKNGNFVFNNMKLVDILKQLERWYDLEVDLNNIPDTRYHVFISKNVSLAEVLDMLEVTGGLKFKSESIENSEKKRITIINKF